MATITTEPTNQDDVYQEYILRKYVEMLVAERVYNRFAEPASIPKNSGGRDAVWNIPQHVEPTGGETPTPLGQLTTDAGDNELASPTITGVTGTIEPYGDWFPISNLHNETALRATLDAYAEQIMDTGLTVIERLVRNAMNTCTNFLHAGEGTINGVTLTGTDKLTINDFPVIAGYFRGNNAKGWKELSGDFALIADPNVEVDLISDADWRTANQHVPKGFEQLINNHQFIGRFAGVSAMRSTEVTGIVEDVSAYKCNAVARWGVGNCGITKKGPTKPVIKIKHPGKNTTSQPLDTYSTLGHKTKMVAAMLDDARNLAVYSAHASAI